jgi:hypothetical protein
VACDEQEWNFSADENIGYIVSEYPSQLEIEHCEVDLASGSKSPRFIQRESRADDGVAKLGKLIGNEESDEGLILYNEHTRG